MEQDYEEDFKLGLKASEIKSKWATMDGKKKAITISLFMLLFLGIGIVIGYSLGASFMKQNCDIFINQTMEKCLLFR